MNTVMPRTPMAQTASNWQSLSLVFVLMLTVHTITSSDSFLLLDECNLRLLPYRDLLLRPVDLHFLCCHNEYAGYPGCLLDIFQINNSIFSLCVLADFSVSVISSFSGSPSQVWRTMLQDKATIIFHMTFCFLSPITSGLQNQSWQNRLSSNYIFAICSVNKIDCKRISRSVFLFNLDYFLSKWIQF